MDKYKVRFYSGTIKDVTDVLKFCGVEPSKVKFSRVILKRGVLTMETTVDATTKACLDILQERAIESISDDNIVYITEVG